MGIVPQLGAASQSSPSARAGRAAAELHVPGEERLSKRFPALKTSAETPGASSAGEKKKKKKTRKKKKKEKPGMNSCHALHREVCLYSTRSRAEPAVRATLGERAKPCRDERMRSTGTASPGIYTWKKKSLKGISQRAVLIRHRSLTCWVAVQHERSCSGAGNTGSISGYLGGESCR